MGAGERLGEARASGGLWIAESMVIEPRRVLEAWLDGSRRLEAVVSAVRRAEGGWGILGDGGEVLARADVVCVAAGFGALGLRPDLTLEPVRGQASFAALDDRPHAAAWGGYLIPTRNGVLFGATHDRGRDDVAVVAEDHIRNLNTLAQARPALAERLRELPLEGRAALRASTPDRAPIAGEMEPGLLALTGLGGRGFTLAPLLAEHIAAVALGAPSPLPGDLSTAIGPRPFRTRAAHTTS